MNSKNATLLAKHFVNFLILIFLTITIKAQSKDTYQYLSPAPNSQYVNKETNFIIRYSEKINRASLGNKSGIEILGEKSGLHSFDLHLSDDDATILLIPQNIFTPGEKIFFSFNSEIKTLTGVKLPSLNYEFTISQNLSDISYSIIPNEDVTPEQLNSTILNKKLLDDNLPSNFPALRVVNNGFSAEGYIFINTAENSSGIGNYIIMVKDDGKPYWYKENTNHYSYDFKTQPNGLLSFADVKESYYFAGGGYSVHKIMDSSYAIIDSFKAGNGYRADSHDFQLLPNGHALLFCYDLQQVDMSKIVSGGNPGAYVSGSIIQELDKNKNVVFQWRTWDYININESYFDLKLAAFDPMHANAVVQDYDGNIIVSFRNISQIIKIDRSTGKIIWRMGGKKNEFTFLNEHSENAPLYFSRPHDVRLISKNHLTLFDNGLDHKPQYSRGVEYEIDEVNKTAKLVWEFKHPNKLYGATQGSVQRLANGNTLIAWGNASLVNNANPVSSEITPEGNIVSELYFDNKGLVTYRALKFPWKMNTGNSTVTMYEIWAGNEYSFNNTKDSTFTRLKVSSFSGSAYNSVTIKYSKKSPLNPVFTSKTPVLYNRIIEISSNEIKNEKGELYFEIKKILPDVDPLKIKVYGRANESESFVELNSTYNSVTKELIAAFTKFGQFIFGVPYQEQSLLQPKLVSPIDSSFVNQELPLQLKWTSNGYVNSFRLQISLDANFNNILVEESGLLNSYYNFTSLQKLTSYYWRVKSISENGESEWSEKFYFKSSAPFISLKTPNGGENIQRGLKYYIRWDDIIDENVEISLLKNEVLFAVLDTVESNGVYQWLPKSDLTLGNDYKISIASIKDSNILDISSNKFSIIDTITVSIDGDIIPTSFLLEQNYPNPFNPETFIKYTIAKPSKVSLKVYDLLGDEISTLVDEIKQPGNYLTKFSIHNLHLSSGIYFYKLTADNFIQTKKMILLK